MVAQRRAEQRLQVREIAPASVLTPQEYANLQALRSRAAGRVSALRQDLAELEQALMGRFTGAEGRAVEAVKPRVTLYRSLLAQVQVVPSVSAEQSPSEILASFGQNGLQERSYDKVVPVTAPNPITDTGNWYDAKDVFDAWILNPSIDTKFDFEGPPSQNTPFISANSRLQFQIRAQKVYYLAQNPGTQGVLQIWLLKYRR